MDWKDLRKKAASKIEAAKALQAQADDEERDLTEEELEKIDALLDEASKLQAQADRRERLKTASDNLDEPLPRRTRPDPVGGDSPRTDTEPKDHDKDARFGFADIGEYLVAIVDAERAGGALDNRLTFYGAASGHHGASGPDGAFLLSPEFSQQVQTRFVQNVFSLLGRTDQIPVTGDTLTVPAVNETSRADGSRWGGVTGRWKSEVEQMTHSGAKFRELKLEPQELYVFTYASGKLLRNAAALNTLMPRAASEEIDFKVSDAIVNGTGAGQPLGVLNSDSTIVVAKEGSQAADTVLFANIVKMWSRLDARARARSVFYINQDVEPQLLQLAFDPGATSKVPAYMPANGLSDSPFATLMGRPVIPIEYCQTLGDKGDIILADLSSYATGLRSGLQSAMSIHLRFDFNETAFRWIFEVDGKPWLEQAITPKNGTATISPVVTLAARA